MRAQTAVEYGLIVATVGVLVLLGVSTYGAQLTTWFSQLATRISATAT